MPLKLPITTSTCVRVHVLCAYILVYHAFTTSSISLFRWCFQRQIYRFAGDAGVVTIRCTIRMRFGLCVRVDRHSGRLLTGPRRRAILHGINVLCDRIRKSLVAIVVADLPTIKRWDNLNGEPMRCKRIEQSGGLVRVA